MNIRIISSENLSTAIIYLPDNPKKKQFSDFFCFEPVSHMVNAHNFSGYPGLTSLSKEETLIAWVRYQWDFNKL